MEQKEKTVYTTDWITSHDLSLVFDPRGRLWQFRSTAYRAPAVGAAVEDGELVVTLEAPGAHPGDLAVELDGRVLKITGEAGSARGLVATVGLPGRVALHALTTAYADGAFEVRVPLGPAPAETPAAEAVPVAC